MTRLSESKIKAAILNPDLSLRLRAIDYFADSNSADPSVMPLVIQAAEAFGRNDAFQMIGSASTLPQTAETITWVIDQLNNEPQESSEDSEAYRYDLLRLLSKADSELLKAEAAALSVRHMSPDFQEVITERVEMLSWDAETGWRKLEEYCEAHKDNEGFHGDALNRGYRIVESIARHGADCQERVQAILSQKIENYQNDPMAWMELMVVRLAGQARLDSTVPVLIEKLMADQDELLNDATSRALGAMGTLATLEAMAASYHEMPRGVRPFAVKPLELTHSDLAVEKMPATAARRT